MKIIELLNKIANGKEVPNKIKYNGKVYFYHKGYDFDYAYTTDEGSYLNENKSLFQFSSYKDNCWNDNSMIEFLNDEVEIIEEPHEHKIPEKLESYISCGWAGTCKDLKREDLFNDLKKIGSKINEILDYLEANNE